MHRLDHDSSFRILRKAHHSLVAAEIILLHSKRVKVLPIIGAMPQFHNCLFVLTIQLSTPPYPVENHHELNTPCLWNLIHILIPIHSLAPVTCATPVKHQRQNLVRQDDFDRSLSMGKPSSIYFRIHSQSIRGAGLDQRDARNALNRDECLPKP